MRLLSIAVLMLLAGCGGGPPVPDRPLHLYQITYADGRCDTITAANCSAKEYWGKITYDFDAGQPFTYPTFHYVAFISQPCTVVQLEDRP